MKGMYAVHYYLVNDGFGCFEWFKDKETAQRSFAKKKTNGNYQRAQLFDENGKKIDEFSR